MVPVWLTVIGKIIFSSFQVDWKSLNALHYFLFKLYVDYVAQTGMTQASEDIQGEGAKGAQTEEVGRDMGQVHQVHQAQRS